MECRRHGYLCRIRIRPVDYGHHDGAGTRFGHGVREDALPRPDFLERKQRCRGLQQLPERYGDRYPAAGCHGTQ